MSPPARPAGSDWNRSGGRGPGTDSGVSRQSFGRASSSPHRPGGLPSMGVADAGGAPSSTRPPVGPRPRTPRNLRGPEKRPWPVGAARKANSARSPKRACGRAHDLSCRRRHCEFSRRSLPYAPLQNLRRPTLPGVRTRHDDPPPCLPIALPATNRPIGWRSAAITPARPEGICLASDSMRGLRTGPLGAIVWSSVECTASARRLQMTRWPCVVVSRGTNPRRQAIAPMPPLLPPGRPHPTDRPSVPCRRRRCGRHGLGAAGRARAAEPQARERIVWWPGERLRAEHDASTGQPSATDAASGRHERMKSLD